MNVRDLMTSDVKTCRPETNLAEAVRAMWEGDYGWGDAFGDSLRRTW